MVIRYKAAFSSIDAAVTPSLAKKSRGHTRPAQPLIDINGPGRLRVSNLMALFGVAHSTLYARIRAGEIPPRDGKDGKLPFWYTETIRPYVTKE